MSVALIAEIEKTREAISGLQSEIDWTRNARLPKIEASKRVEQAIDLLGAEIDFVLAQAADVETHPVRIVRGWLSPRTTPVMVGPTDRPTSQVVEVRTAPLLAWLFGPEIKKRLVRALEQADYTAGPPAAERPGRLADLGKQLLELEILEERLIEQAESSGLEVYRRADCNPGVVLAFDADRPGDVPPRSALPRGIEGAPAIVGAVKSAAPGGSVQSAPYRIA